jgi:hypothetical protein
MEDRDVLGVRIGVADGHVEDGHLGEPHHVGPACKRTEHRCGACQQSFAGTFVLVIDVERPSASASSDWDRC